MQAENLNPDALPTQSAEKTLERDSEVYFFSTSTFKLVVMSICTVGIYNFYWFYKNWMLIRARTGQNMMPFWRAFFSPIWAFSCFEHIKKSANEKNMPQSLPVLFLGGMYFVFQFLSRLPDPYWLVSLLSFLFIIPANRLASSVNKEAIPDFINNERFSGWNWLAIFVGCVFHLMLLLGMLLEAGLIGY
ncbi:hypothetical protein KDD30_08225 [Photobacterium sp. GJ3]|uniref:hypothetical protein n=1 Tax=Photobacterium sp. GJ3 TaxID=2829502 RepID=UPI001B8ADD66|nr:hypothetical protein [Photobacterium sp. GJ3]QUJ66187.1 hypothetical protein KDD30_08225 [Photobacterium sp. GJ3]